MKPILILIFIGGILYACRNQPKTTVPNYGEKPKMETSIMNSTLKRVVDLLIHYNRLVLVIGLSSILVLPHLPKSEIRKNAFLYQVL